MIERTRPIEPAPDGLDRAIASVQAAVGTLVGLLGEPDWPTIVKVFAALVEIGPCCVGALASALPIARTPRHRAAIVASLLYFGAQVRVPVTRALTRLPKEEKDPEVRTGDEIAFPKLVRDDPVETAASAPAGAEPAGT